MDYAMNTAAGGDAKFLDLHGPQVFTVGTEVLGTQPTEQNKYVDPTGLAVAHQLTKLEQIVEYLKVLYR
jgi:hypothetical protein